MTYKDWISRDKYAQLIGLIAHEFRYTLEDIGELTVVQVNFLTSWLEWYYQSQRR